MAQRREADMVTVKQILSGCDQTLAKIADWQMQAVPTPGLPRGASHSHVDRIRYTNELICFLHSIGLMVGSMTSNPDCNAARVRLIEQIIMPFAQSFPQVRHSHPMPLRA